MIFCAAPYKPQHVRPAKQVIVCAGCGIDVVRPRKPGKGGALFYCVTCRPLSMAAHTSLQHTVRTAINRGLLPKITADTRCVDCGAAAYGYEHRDFSQPLKVDPICRRCNWKRGAASNLLEAR